MTLTTFLVVWGVFPLALAQLSGSGDGSSVGSGKEDGEGQKLLNASL